MSANNVQQLRATPDHFSPEEWAARVDLAAAYRLAGRLGWHDLLATHFSLRVPGTEGEYLVNPFGLFFEEVTASSLVKIDTEGKLLSPSEYGVNPAADEIHGAIYAARPDVNAVMHLHSVAGTGVATQAGGLLPISQQALLLQVRTRYYDYGGSGIDSVECAKMVAALGDGSVLFMRNHGTLATGHNIGEAFALITRIERACQIQLAAQAGGEIAHIDPEVVAKTIQRGHRIYSEKSWSPHAKIEWAAFRRKLDREDPAYAT
ncbi:class II aldolase/adducin family protein [soil metagenome]